MTNIRYVRESLDNIRNSCDVFFPNLPLSFLSFIWISSLFQIQGLLIVDFFSPPCPSMAAKSVKVSSTCSAKTQCLRLCFCISAHLYFIFCGNRGEYLWADSLPAGHDPESLHPHRVDISAPTISPPTPNHYQDEMSTSTRRISLHAPYNTRQKSPPTSTLPHHFSILKRQIFHPHHFSIYPNQYQVDISTYQALTTCGAFSRQIRPRIIFSWRVGQVFCDICDKSAVINICNKMRQFLLQEMDQEGGKKEKMRQYRE